MNRVIKCVKTKRVLKGNFASSVFHSCNAKTQKKRKFASPVRNVLSCYEYEELLSHCCHTVVIAKFTVEDSGCLRYDSVSLCEWFPVFQRNVMPPSSRSKRQFFRDLSTSDMLGTAHPMTRQHIPEALNPNQHSCKNFTSHAVAHCAFVYTTL
jgi:hypothetical protein